MPTSLSCVIFTWGKVYKGILQIVKHYKYVHIFIYELMYKYISVAYFLNPQFASSLYIATDYLL